jgi:hypothetical protein
LKTRVFRVRVESSRDRRWRANTSIYDPRLYRPLRYFYGLSEVSFDRPHGYTGRNPALPQQSTHAESSANDAFTRHPGLPGLWLVGVFHSEFLALGWMAPLAAPAACAGPDADRQTKHRGSSLIINPHPPRRHRPTHRPVRRYTSRCIAPLRAIRRNPILSQGPSHFSFRRGFRDPTIPCSLFPCFSTCRPCRRRDRQPEPQPSARAARPPELPWSAAAPRWKPRSAGLYESPWSGR